MASPSRESPVFVWLRHSAALALATAEREPGERKSHALSALIHTALMAETFLDVLGAHLDRDWSGKGRRFSRYKRLRVFRLALGCGGDIKARPWRSVADVFDFHDLVVHGRIEAEEKREALELSADELASYAIGDWQDFCTLENARRLFEDVERAMAELTGAAGLGGDGSAAD